MWNVQCHVCVCVWSRDAYCTVIIPTTLVWVILALLPSAISVIVFYTFTVIFWGQLSVQGITIQVCIHAAWPVSIQLATDAMTCMNITTGVQPSKQVRLMASALRIEYDPRRQKKFSLHLHQCCYTIARMSVLVYTLIHQWYFHGVALIYK